MSRSKRSETSTARRAIGCLVLTALLSASPALHAACDPSFQQVNVDGFGDSRNDYIWSLKAFGPDLYAATLNRRGGQIWRWNGVNPWEQVVNWRFIDFGNRGARNMAVFNGALYAGTLNQFTGAEVWRTVDGTDWQQVNDDGFGDPGNQSVRGMAVYDGHLYVGLFSDAQPAELWRTDGVEGVDGIGWEPMVLDGFGDPDNQAISAMAVLGGALYAGTSNENGLQVFRSEDGVNFVPSVAPGATTPQGFGDPNNRNALAMHAFDGQVYVGTTARTLETGSLIGFEVHRTPDGVSYERVAAFGLGDFGNIYAWRFHSFEDQLWLGVFNALNAIFDVKGGSVWRSADGSPGSWEELVGGDGIYHSYGFDDTTNWGIRSFETFQDKLYIGTANCRLERCQPAAMGAELWEWPGEACPQ